MPVERSGTCDMCHQPTSTPVSHGIAVRHGRCQVAWLRGRWLKADASARRVIEDMAECVTRQCDEYDRECREKESGLYNASTGDGHG
jgi:hypothetical protein